jgi:hypothetical protein
MKRSLPALAACLALLVQAAPATAKKIVKAQVCGASGCSEITDRDMLAALPEGGDPTDPPSHASGWYRATLTVAAGDARDSFSLAALPDAGYLRSEKDPVIGGYNWMRMTPAAAAAYRSAVRGIRPFPASRLGGLSDAPNGSQVAAADRQVPQRAPDDDGVPVWVLALAIGGALAAAAALLRRRWMPTVRARRAS